MDDEKIQKSKYKSKKVKDPKLVPLGILANRVMSLRQLKEIINDIYSQKQKYDKLCASTRMPRETME